jgi:hypothetical protein
MLLAFRRREVEILITMKHSDHPDLRMDSNNIFEDKVVVVLWSVECSTPRNESMFYC